jgi:predicted pyridoxine 5'-phosphate oxidase superfamily flavin-nucleotide-binding protein
MDLPREVSELFAEEMAAKFLATADDEGRVNVALIVTLQPPPDGKKDRLIFGEFLMWKSKSNLEENPRVAAAVVNMKLKMATLLGDFQGFEKKGHYKDSIDASPFMRYNAYSGVRAAGVIDVKEVGPFRGPFMPSLASDFVRLRMHRAGDLNGEISVPRLVKEKFTKLTSIKALAVMGEDGYPRVYPVLTVAPAGDGGFRLWTAKYNREMMDIRVPCRAAMSLVTMDAKSYKVVGELRAGDSKTLVLKVEEVYNSMPPLAGERIVPRTEIGAGVG